MHVKRWTRKEHKRSGHKTRKKNEARKKKKEARKKERHEGT